MDDGLNRRQLIGLLGGAAAARPLGASAQQSSKLPMLGFRAPNTSAAASDRIAAFEERLHELGWLPNRSLTIHYEWADGKAELFKEIAAQFVRVRISDEAGHAFQCEAGHLFRSEAGRGSDLMSATVRRASAGRWG